MALISFAKSTQEGWNKLLDHRLKTALRDIAFEFGGIWITCLDRDAAKNEQLGGVKNSKHLLNADGKCQAADFVLMDAALNDGVIDYVKRYYSGLGIIFHNVKTGLHFHVEIKKDVQLLV